VSLLGLPHGWYTPSWIPLARCHSISDERVAVGGSHGFVGHSSLLGIQIGCSLSLLAFFPSHIGAHIIQFTNCDIGQVAETRRDETRRDSLPMLSKSTIAILPPPLPSLFREYNPVLGRELLRSGDSSASSVYSYQGGIRMHVGIDAAIRSSQRWREDLRRKCWRYKYLDRQIPRQVYALILAQLCTVNTSSYSQRRRRRRGTNNSHTDTSSVHKKQVILPSLLPTGPSTTCLLASTAPPEPPY